MKKKTDWRKTLLTVISALTYLAAVVFNFSHMSDSTGSRKPGFLTAGLFLLTAFIYVIYKRRDKKPLVIGTVFWSIALACSLITLLMYFAYSDWMSISYLLMMFFMPPAFGIAAPFKADNTLYFLILLAIPTAELLLHIILLTLRGKKKK